MSKRRLIGCFCLLLYLLAWVGSAQAIPLLLTSVGHAHKIFLTYHGDKIQIALHHPGYVDQHEPVATTSLEAYQHDLLDKALLALDVRADHDYSDHVIQLPLDKPPILTTSQKIDSKETKASPAFSFLATAPPFPALAELACARHLGQPPPAVPSIPLHLPTTVLLN
ncbi:hypothetical protein [Nitrosococcus wardiae]|uniref:Uncharacterized protein n=1 Tax=Nitrosococcus wardiae TaxID=1814290 RepID=A0A4P7C1Z1_9GAMM|nr:hypothetical protein [Nitrosococcus wardiae]QBQ55660.1 hypothetical protein E3U44_14920 [Nitrosococcus wardiae]